MAFKPNYRFERAQRDRPKALKGDDPAWQAEAAKTARLRALRLPKEAADKETAIRDAAAAQARRSEPRRRVRGPQASTPSEPK
jgi:hypothetical protein